MIKKSFIFTVSIIFLVFILIGIFSIQSLKTKEIKEADYSVPVFSLKESTIDKKVNDLLNRMTLEEKIGQLIVVGFKSKEVDDHIKTMISDYKVGGVILYDRNMKNPEQVTNLTNDLQALAFKNDSEIPLLLSVDQEGGKIVRMREYVSPIPSQQELAGKGDRETVYNTALQSGKELKKLGIHVNYAPVLDLSAEDSRSYGENPRQAGEFAKQAVLGLTQAGVTATLKHFPGHGRSTIDPHFETSSVEANQADLENKDLYPFKKIINEVDHSKFFVMVTHIKYPAYDKEKPASISVKIMKDLLREKLGYEGIVVTDDLEMGAVNKYYTYKELGYEAVNAGADLLLVCHTLESQREVINGIRDAVLENKLSEETIDEAVKRILNYKLSNIKV